MIIRRKMAIKDYAKVFDLLDLQHVTTIQGDKLASFTNFKVGLFGKGSNIAILRTEVAPVWSLGIHHKLFSQSWRLNFRIEQIAFCLWVDSYS